MAYSKITLEFIAVPVEWDDLIIGESSLGLSFLSIFKDSRLGTAQVTIPTYVPEPEGYLGFVNVNYKNAFNLDYNSTGLFTLSTINGPSGSGVGFVTIQANYSGAIFTGTSNAFVDVNIENEVLAPAFSIDSVTFTTKTSEESTKCLVNIATNHLATKILQPNVVNPNTENPIIFAAYRATTFNVEVEDVEGLKVSQSVTTPAYLNIDNFTFDIVNYPSGGTLNISNVNSNGLVLQYSLNNITWQSSPIFSGLEVGSYTFYIKDQLGYSISKDIEVNEFGIYTPFFYISKSNSFRFANRITWGDSANYKTDENTLSHEAFAKDPSLAYYEVQQFQSADVITTQFKSNYATNVAKIIKSDLTEVNIPVTKKTNNIGIKDKRDAFKYNLGGGKTGIYFIAGNIYDYTTGLASGTHFLNGLVPEWGQVGNYIQISAAWFLIEDSIYDETKNADVLVISNVYTGSDASIIVSSIYNRFNYEVYEFTIDMVDYIDQYFQVRINNADTHFTEIIHLSEQIWCKVKHDKVLEIRYSNSTNTDMFYATGIENLIRFPYTFIKGKIDEENENYKTDTNVVLLNSEMYEVDEIVFEPVTKELWRKLTQALSHEKVTINGIGYAKNGNFNTEGPLEESNLYVLTATMIKTGSIYNSQSSGGLSFDGTSVEVPGLIEGDDGFVSY